MRTKHKKPMNGGRKTKFSPEFVNQAYIACSKWGARRVDLGDLFGVSKVTIHNWCSSFPEFRNAIEKGTKEFDTVKVEKSLLKRALGYDYEEVHVTDSDKGHSVKTIKKQIAPDVTAQIFWLTNRNPDKWKHVRQVQVESKADEEYRYYEEQKLADRLGVEGLEQLRKLITAQGDGQDSVSEDNQSAVGGTEPETLH